MYPAANRNSSLNRLLQRAATALEPPANVSPQPTSYDPLNTIQSLFLPPAALSYAFFNFLFSESVFPSFKDNLPSIIFVPSPNEPLPKPRIKLDPLYCTS